MNSKSADILQTPSEPLLEYFGETTINNVKETAKNWYDKFKETLISIKHTLNALKQVTGIRQLLNLIKTALREAPLIGQLYKNHTSETLDEKVSRINDVNSFSECSYIIYDVVNVIAKLLYKSVVAFRTILSPSTLYNTIFEDENKFVDRFNNSKYVSTYKQMYELLRQANIPDKFCAAYIISMASISPFYFIMALMDNKNSKAVTDPEFYNSPFMYNGGSNPNTGLDRFEKKLIDSTQAIIERYNDSDNEFEKNYILAKEILKQTLVCVLSNMLIFVPIAFNTHTGSYIKSTFGFIGFILQLACLMYSVLVLVLNLIYAHLGLDAETKKLKNEEISSRP